MASGEQLTLNHKAVLLEELKDPVYRQAFVEGHAKDTIAFQIRQLRKAKEWEQRDLARELGNPKLQPMISRYENPDYGRYSITTLLELANAFDVALVVRFAPFSELVEWDWQSTSATLAPTPYREDKRLARMEKSISSPEESQRRLANLPSAMATTAEPTPGSFGKPKSETSQPMAQAAYSGAA